MHRISCVFVMPLFAEKSEATQEGCTDGDAVALTAAISLYYMAQSAYLGLVTTGSEVYTPPINPQAGLGRRGRNPRTSAG